MDISIIGSGYVGLVTGACFADVGHNVICVDNDESKIKTLQSGRIPIYEPGLEEIVHRNVSAHRLHFSSSIREGVDKSQIIFIAVPTPPQPNGDVDLSFIEKVSREIADVLTDYRVIVDKSTVPVKTGERVAETIKRYNRHGAKFDVVSNPEFLREGTELLGETKALTKFKAGSAPEVAPSADPHLRARENLAHALLNHTEFVTIR